MFREVDLFSLVAGLAAFVCAWGRRSDESNAYPTQAFDYCLTFSLEVLHFNLCAQSSSMVNQVKYVWGTKWDTTRIVFTLSRYLPFLSSSLTCYGMCHIFVFIGVSWYFLYSEALVNKQVSTLIPPSCWLCQASSSVRGFHPCFGWSERFIARYMGLDMFSQPCTLLVSF